MHTECFHLFDHGLCRDIRHFFLRRIFPSALSLLLFAPVGRKTERALPYLVLYPIEYYNTLNINHHIFAMEKFDAKAELARIKELRQIKRYRKSKLDRYRGEILALADEGASSADITLWLRERKIKAVSSTIARYIEKQKALLADMPKDN
jgi:hypothetical protein